MQAGSGPSRLFLLLLSVLVLAFFAVHVRPISLFDQSQTPQCWEVRINMKTDGDYRLEEGGPAFAGRYSFVVCWTGWLEKEDNDYLLYRLDTQLLNWTAEETTSLTENSEFLTAEDFRERPTFSLKYIIRDGEDLSLDFIVDPMTVPQARSEGGFPLLLPSSEQHNQRESQISYNAHIIKGSNRVKIPELAIYAGPVARTFAWEWRHQEWLPQERQTTFASQSHDVEVDVSITPRFSPPKRRGY
jgi:hypothetical protein